jgi:hypothetical protein
MFYEQLAPKTPQQAEFGQHRGRCVFIIAPTLVLAVRAITLCSFFSGVGLRRTNE